MKNVIAKTMIPIGLILGALGLYLAIYQSSDVWYSFFLIGGFLFLEGLNARNGFSVLGHIRQFIKIWIIFIVITIAVEIIGNVWLNLWQYPTFGVFDYIIHVLIIGYLLTAFFGLEFFVLIQRLFPSKISRALALPISAFLFGYLNEYPNIFAYEWKYINWPFGEFLGIPILVSILWILLLLVVPFKKSFEK